MKPERQSEVLLAVTRSKAKMYEYGVDEAHHIEMKRDPERLFGLAIGLLGDFAAETNAQGEGDHIDELREVLQFSARFFDAYLESRLNEEADPYLLLLGAASYYLCNLPGSSLVLAKRLGESHPDLGSLGLEDLLLWLLQGNWTTVFEDYGGFYGEYIDTISRRLSDFFENGEGEEYLRETILGLRRSAYDNGSARELLFADVICAIIERRLQNSTWRCLPSYSHLSIDQWQNVLRRESFIRELWPAQHLLGQNGIFRGRSAVVQMPTSAGKTKATEIIIRSAFLANRTSLAVVVAPFRALCHEIRNSLLEAFDDEYATVDELSDVLQPDFQIGEFLDTRQVLVVTPEKLLYVLRSAPELAENIGLLVYDEGHQFDSGTRGITYELLLTSLKSMVPEGVQTVLISAVISNASAIGQWLNGEDSEVVQGSSLSPTYRTVAFASWLDQRGRLEFVTQEAPEDNQFFVPRIIEQQELRLRGKERKQRMFPVRDDGQTIALFLGLKLAANGAVAVFCGRKTTASGLCEKLVDAYDRALPTARPVEYSDQDEVGRLHSLCECNLGKDAIATRSAALGVFAHHGNTPQGLRLAIEHAMKEGLTRFVVCTSTLAQGVNLPIRYLIVTGVYQGAQRIKVRDFHNLLGRTGRAGMYTEGSVVFADPVVYDKRKAWKDGWRWRQVKELLEPGNSEPCASTLLSIFEPLQSDDEKRYIKMEPFFIAEKYVNAPQELESLPGELAAADGLKGLFSEKEIAAQIAKKTELISAIESYLMAQWNEQEKDVADLAKSTLAYFLADDKQRAQIVDLFKLLAENIVKRIPDVSRRAIYARNLYGVRASMEIEEWVTSNIDVLLACEEPEELLRALWVLLADNVRNNSFRKCDPSAALINVALGWIKGKRFYELLDGLAESEAKLIWGQKRRHFKVEHVVDICENGLAYDATLVVGAVSELVEFIRPEDCEELITRLRRLQKRLKYGLPSARSIILYELGFSDRVVAIDLSRMLRKTPPQKGAITKRIRAEEASVRQILRKYPSYFTRRLDDLL